MKSLGEILSVLALSMGISYLPVSAFEQADLKSQSMKIELDQEYKRIIGGGLFHVYEIDLKYKSDYQFAVRQKLSDLDFEVVDEKGKSMGMCDEHGMGKDEVCIFELEPGKYFIFIEEMWDEFTSYQLKVEDVHEFMYY